MVAGAKSDSFAYPRQVRFLTPSRNNRYAVQDEIVYRYYTYGYRCALACIEDPERTSRCMMSVGESGSIPGLVAQHLTPAPEAENAPLGKFVPHY